MFDIRAVEFKGKSLENFEFCGSSRVFEVESTHKVPIISKMFEFLVFLMVDFFRHFVMKVVKEIIA